MQGYFSVLQYQAVPERGEGRNVAVVLWTGGRSYVRRLAQLAHLGPWAEGDVEAMLTRLRELDGFPAQIRHFAACEVGHLVVLPPRSVAVQDDPEAEVDALFAQLVS